MVDQPKALIWFPKVFLTPLVSCCKFIEEEQSPFSHTHAKGWHVQSIFTPTCKRMTSSKIWGTYYFIPSTRAALRWSPRAKAFIPRINKGPRMKAALVNQLSPRLLFPGWIPQQEDCTNLQWREWQEVGNYLFPLEFQKQDNSQNCQNQTLSVWLKTNNGLFIQVLS